MIGNYHRCTYVCKYTAVMGILSFGFFLHGLQIDKKVWKLLASDMLSWFCFISLSLCRHLQNWAIIWNWETLLPVNLYEEQIILPRKFLQRIFNVKRQTNKQNVDLQLIKGIMQTAGKISCEEILREILSGLYIHWR